MLQKWLLFLFFPFKKAAISFLFSFKQTPVDVFYDAFDQVNLQQDFDTCEAKKETGYENRCIEDSWLNQYLYGSTTASFSETMLSTQEFIHEFEDSRVLFDEMLAISEEGSVSPAVSSFDSLSDDYCCTISAGDVLFDHEILPARYGSNSPVRSNLEDIDPFCNSQLFDEMLTVSDQEGSVSPVSDFNSFNTKNDCCCSTATVSAADDMLVDHDRCSQPFCVSNSPVINIQQDIDPFHQNYTSRMRFFNLLYHERLYGINAILNEHLSIRGFSAARMRLLRSLESDLEMIYVAQSCLFWEALHHQYQKVEALTFSDNYQNIVFHHTVSEKYQQLQILLERFVEDQKCEVQKSSEERLSFQGLLQVPHVTGFMNIEEGGGIKATQVSDAINNCIKAFWLYIKKTDNKKSSWKYNGIRSTYHPPVEDPQDLELLYNVAKTLHKKGIMVKDLQGKSKCWVRRVKAIQTDDEKRDLVFAMIDMKLVQRLLEMRPVSKSQLKWCQEKLNNLDFKDGKVFRSPISHLFPSS